MSQMAKNERYAVITSLFSAGVFASMSYAAGLRTSAMALPLLLFLPVFVHLQFKEKLLKCTPETLMNETPSVIGMMAVTLSSGGSFDTAVRDVADNGPRYMSEIFSKAVREADCRSVPDIRGSILSTVASFPKELSSFKRAMHMVVTAFESCEPDEREGMMKDAQNIVLDGLKTMGNTYSSKLNTPCMAIFAIGILVPMILISILPMLSMGGMFAVSFIDSDVLTFAVLVLIPALMLVLIMSVRGKNPFFRPEMKAEDVKYLAPFIIVIPVYYVLSGSGLDQGNALALSLIAAGIITYAALLPSIAAEKRRTAGENALKDALFELGNRLSMGENFDTAVRKALSSGKDANEIYVALDRELVLCRGDVVSAIRKFLGPISKIMSDYYCDVYRASLRDSRVAGKLASGIAHQLQDQATVMKDIENKLKSMLDMMTGTSALFAPIILGMSVVMLGPITEITGQVFFEDIGLVLIAYLAELAAMISILSSNLMCRGNASDIMGRFCIMMPLALTVFLGCTMISI